MKLNTTTINKKNTLVKCTESNPHRQFSTTIYFEQAQAGYAILVH